MHWNDVKRRQKIEVAINFILWDSLYNDLEMKSILPRLYELLIDTKKMQVGSELYVQFSKVDKSGRLILVFSKEKTIEILQPSDYNNVDMFALFSVVVDHCFGHECVPLR